jgi:purine-binding chemotaxis protein CheW
MAETTQVLEFELGTERYCVDIRYVAEIVDMDELTPVPNTPEHVEGVMDLRGRTTSIVNPRTVLGVTENGDGARERVVVFDPDELPEQGAVGWVVDGVDQVTHIDPANADDPPGEDDAVEGVVQRDDGFLVWVSPEAVN